MKIKKNTVLLLSLLLTLPFISAFIYAENFQQRWWQRKKTPEPPTEISTLENDTGYLLEINFKAGKRHNHPLMAFWIEDTSGTYIQSLYVAQSIATGYFGHGDASEGYWQPGPLRRPAALPYWGHKRGIKASDGYYIPEQSSPMPDAVTGPTPSADFILTTRTSGKQPEVFNILMEINQSWDWNQHWHNNKYPDDPYYKTSSQPAVVFMATIDTRSDQTTWTMMPIGHSHWSGENGELYDDLNTLTTALEIVKDIVITLK